ncbi:MAG TPA: hypothetical protein EYP39_00810 [Ghiorsea sp.]|nr:hypothetical protein [Ghiorsea sp.]
MKFFVLSLSAMFAMLFSTHVAHAEQQALTNFNSNYATNVTSCNLCHGGIPGLNSFGLDFRAQGGTKAAYNANFAGLDALDSDGNGTNNGIQIRTDALSPADANITLASLSDPLPQDFASTTGCMTSGFATPWLMFFAMFMFGFMVKRKRS